MKLFLVLGVIAIIGITGITVSEQVSETQIPENITRITTSDELSEYILAQEISPDQGYYGTKNGIGWYTDGDAMSEGTLAPTAAMPALANLDSAGADDFSTTNIQVEGVDEADFVKNDGRYIYIITGDLLTIVDAFPAESAKILSETEVTGSPADLFLKGDRLVVFATDRVEDWIQPEGSATPVPRRSEVTHAYIYSVADRMKPELLRDIEISGTYRDARMTGEYVYAVTKDSISWNGRQVVMPEIRVGGEAVVSPVWCPDILYPGYIFHTITSFNIRKETSPEAESFLIGSGQTFYVSEKNIYLAYPKRGGYGPRSEPSRQMSVIHRFGINDGDITYGATGEAPGRLLNQFSLDEYMGNLRVAATVQGRDAETSYQYSGVYVLDSDLEVIGSLEYLAPEERIYAARFMGDKLYLVTFKQIDPLFVIDLSNPEEPGVLGELKIPGYSDYLHPYDSDHLIGIGKETEENQWGGVSVAGLKIALFDVSDLNNPALISSVQIGEAGTDSEALCDHRAFLFDKSRNLLVIPVREVKAVAVSDSKYPGSYSRKIWQGAYVYGVTPQEGFVLKGTVLHDEDDGHYSFWGSPSAVKRSLYMDDVLYTISDSLIVMSDLSDPDKRLNEVLLQSRGDGGSRPYLV